MLLEGARRLVEEQRGVLGRMLNGDPQLLDLIKRPRSNRRRAGKSA